MYNLFIDDIRQPNWVTLYRTKDYNKFKWIVVKSYDEFVDYIIKNGMPKLISYDHDLADEHYIVTDVAIRNGLDIRDYGFKEKTGYDALKWLCEYALDNKIKLPEIKFHTANIVGLENMKMYLYNFLKHYPELK